MTTKIEQLIEKYAQRIGSDYHHGIASCEEVIKDIQSLQPTTKEKKVEISPYDLLGCNKCNNIPFKGDKYCSGCGAKIKRVD